MEKKNAKIKNTFTQIIGHISKLYKDCSNLNSESYLIGKKEAFEEILNWFVTNHNGELKYVSATSFFNMIQEKLAKTRTAIASKQGDEAEEEINLKPTMNFSEIKISDNRKRINKYAQMERDHNFGYSENLIMEEVSSNASNLINQQVISGGNNSASLGVQNSSIGFPFSVSSLINGNRGGTENSIMSGNNLAEAQTLNNNSNFNIGLDSFSLRNNNQTNQSATNSSSNSIYPNNQFNSNPLTFPNPFTNINTNNNTNTLNPNQSNIISPNLNTNLPNNFYLPPNSNLPNSTNNSHNAQNVQSVQNAQNAQNAQNINPSNFFAGTVKKKKNKS